MRWVVTAVQKRPNLSAAVPIRVEETSAIVMVTVAVRVHAQPVRIAMLMFAGLNARPEETPVGKGTLAIASVGV